MQWNEKKGFLELPPPAVAIRWRIQSTLGDGLPSILAVYQMFLCQLALLLALAAQAAGSSTPLLQMAQPQPEEAASPRLGLFFSANIDAACVGRCSLSASTAPCDGGNANASAPALLEPWNSLLLAGRWQHQDFIIIVKIDCSDPACIPAPASLLAWRSDGNGISACAQQADADRQPPQPRLLPGLAGDGDAVYMLDGGDPLVAVSYDPSAAAAAMAAATAHEAQEECERQLLAAAACEASSGPAAAVEPTGETTAASVQGPQCKMQRLLALRLAVAAWVLACTSAGALL